MTHDHPQAREHDPGRPQDQPSDEPGIRIGSLFSVPILLMPSWFVIAALVTFFYARNLAGVPGLSTASTYLVGLCAALLLLFSVFLHEVAHAVAARSVGTAPTRIVLDLWGGHTAFEREMTTPGRSAFVSLVGPATNAAIAGIGLLIRPAVPDGVPRLLLEGMILTNAFVAVFNALPGLPLDGGRALEALVWKITGRRTTGALVAGWIGRAVAVALVLWALLPLLQGRTPSLFTMLWTLLVAGTLWRGASGALEMARFTDRSESLTVAELTRPAAVVRAGSSVGAGLQAAEAIEARAVVLLGADGRPWALMDPAALTQVPEQRLGTTPAEAVALALPPHALVPQSLGGDPLIRFLQANPAAEYVVLDAQGGVAGVLFTEDVVDRLGGRKS